ncbi:vWA domain-containing protein [Taklimakanibacter lacteus]|uniref:vWA domain-containing protein n=1 Tax=Taklimakanibacter lacteus TaxID=2268456 RepID=UPI000E6698EC
MTDELDHIKARFRAETAIEPDAAAKAAGIAAAMAHYDENFSKASQGKASGPRLIERVRGVLFGSSKMHGLKLSHGLMAGASLAVISLVAINSGLLHEVQNIPFTPGVDQDEEAKLASPAPEPAKKEAAPLPSMPSTVVARQKAVEFDAGAISGYLEKTPAPGLALPADQPQVHYQDQGRDKFSDIETNPVKIARDEPVSTFSIDVDTSSYSFVRAELNQNVLPQKDAVRVEEMINYFPYDYAGPVDKAVPFKTNVSVFPSPWNPDTKLMHVGIKGFALNGQEKPKSNLVFLIDTSGSMDSPDKLPLLRNAMTMLVETLGPEDTVSIVTYAGSAGTVLEPTKAKDKAKIIGALDRLMAGGSTAGAEGIRQAYQLAEQSFDKTGINRVILATDGDFNVGITDPEELKSFVERKRETGVTLSVLGFGRGNYNDEMMQTLAQNGNGNAAYIDTINEARKVLVDEVSSTLFTIAQDVKIQVEFNPDTVSEYRLIGYETRMLKREDFNNDKVDAGDIGSGHTVTAIYEITPRDSKAKLNDDLRYGASETPAKAGADEYGFVKIRYKLPGEKDSKLISEPVKVSAASATVDAAPQEARFSAAVAAFGQLLRGGQYTRSYSYDDVIALAQAAKGTDAFGYRAEFINLMRLAKTAQGLEPLKQ